MSSRKMKLGDFLIRSKIPVDIEDNKQYKRVTIRTKHQGVSVRDFEIGSKIGTKKQFILKAGQFVLSKIDAMYGAFGIAPDEVDGAIITGNFWAYDYDKNMVSIEWLNHFTNSPDFYDLCRRASTGITHRKYLDEDFFLSYEVNLPDLVEQENLVFSIDSIREKISSLETELAYQLTQLENLNQAILQEAVQGKLVKQDPKDEPACELLKQIKAEKAKSGKKEKPLPPIKPEEIPFEIPKSWVWCRLGAVCDINPRNKAVDELEAGFIPMPRVSQIFGVDPTFEIRKWGAIKAGFTHFANNDVVVAKITPCFENSKAGIISGLPNGIGAGTTELHVLRGNEFVIAKYIYAYVKRVDFLKNGEKIMKGVSGQQRVPTEYFYNSLIPLPPISEQYRIVVEIERQLAKTKHLKEHILANQQATEQLLKALLHGAFEVGESHADR